MQKMCIENGPSLPVDIELYRRSQPRPFHSIPHIYNSRRLDGSKFPGKADIYNLSHCTFILDTWSDYQRTNIFDFDLIRLFLYIISPINTRGIPDIFDYRKYNDNRST